MLRASRRGFTSVSAAVAIFAALGGFGCICNVANRARCGGEDDFPLPYDSADADPSDAGDPDASD